MKRLWSTLLIFPLFISLFFSSALAAEIGYGDVSLNAWYYDGISYVTQEGIMIGTSPNTFTPEGYVTRSMMATVIWRLAGNPPLPENMGFWLYHDIPSGAYYEIPVIWAKEQDIMIGYWIPYNPDVDPPTGYSSYNFRPDLPLSREQLATVLYRYAIWKGIDVTGGTCPNTFPDKATVSPWAADAMQWCVANGLIRGTTQNGISVLNPKGITTRGQLATILMRFAELSR